MKKNRTIKISVVLATRNEEQNIGACLDSVKSFADQMIVVDEQSEDRTREIAENHGAEVFIVKHEPIFHITKQKALDKAAGEWVLQLDADERVTPLLAREILEVLRMSDSEILTRKPLNLKKWELFKRHQRLIEERDGSLGKRTGKVVAYFIPRLNYFLGKPLIHGGVYPDGVIRLVKRGKARFPAKSVHEQMEIEGEVAWLFNDLEHHDSPTFKRYIERNNRYTDLIATDLSNHKIPINLFFFVRYSLLIPVKEFISLYFRHAGFLDGYRGFIWSLFSCLRFPVAYFKYWQLSKQ